MNKINNQPIFYSPSYNLDEYIYNNSNPELRMYFLTMYNISPIQQGIQSLHAAAEYSIRYGLNLDYTTWCKKWKTVIVLNGGTSNDGSDFIEGSMEAHKKFLTLNNIRHTVFYEPDLNNAMSAICFILDERFFSKQYPRLEDFYIGNTEEDAVKAFMHSMQFKTQEELELYKWIKQFRFV